MPLPQDEVKCAMCGVKWKSHSYRIGSVEMHPMFWSNLEYLEWLTYERDYEDLQKNKKSI